MFIKKACRLKMETWRVCRPVVENGSFVVNYGDVGGVKGIVYRKQKGGR
jgi:hypothetical protein